jgi:hypothetical protein
MSWKTVASDCKDFSTFGRSVSSFNTLALNSWQQTIIDITSSCKPLKISAANLQTNPYPSDPSMFFFQM